MITVPRQSGDRQPLPNAITISVDTEYIGPQTLTIQTAARLDADTLVVQLYRSAAVPDLPPAWDQSRYLPITDEKYGRFCKQVIVRWRPFIIEQRGGSATPPTTKHGPLSRRPSPGSASHSPPCDCPAGVFAPASRSCN